jgi:hypothetical protein
MRFYFIIITLLASAYAELISLVETCRHGARAPIGNYSWDKGVWKYGLTNLTPEGQRMHYILGTELRRRYIVDNQLLNTTYSPEEIYVRATYINRTIESARAQMMGLYPNGPNLESESQQAKARPPFKVANIDSVLTELGMSALPNNYQPFPVHTVSNREDHLLRGYEAANCPRMKEISAQVQQSDEYKERVAEYENLIKDKLDGLFNESIGFEEAGWRGDVMECDLFHGFPIPDIDTDTLDYMLGIRNYSNSYFFEHGGAQLASSEFFQAIILQFEDAVKGNAVRKFGFYSAHDTTLIGFLSALENFDGQNPPYASTIIFELHREDDKHTVKTIYNDEDLILPGCGTVDCDYEIFREFLHSKTHTDITEACKTSKLFEESRYIYNYFLESRN